MPRPLCFVLMPFGRKDNSQGVTIDFDRIYKDLIKPAIEAAELEPFRADEELTGGIIHKPMFERLILCPYALADLTLANANVFYELGVRHAVRPFSTVAVFAAGPRLPFDVSMMRAIPYDLDGAGVLQDVVAAQQRITQGLLAAREGAVDSPIFQLMDLPWGGTCEELSHEKTDTFRERHDYSEQRKRELAAARLAGIEEVRRIEADVNAKAGKLSNEELGVVIDLFLSYRALRGWTDMIRLVGEMSKPVAQTVMIREQLALALNREAGEQIKRGDEKGGRLRRNEAIDVLEKLVEDRGADSETNGILGRVYKDGWEEARNARQLPLAQSLLQKAIDAYLQGFNADCRDAYPGINAVTLMEIAEPPDPQRKRLLPVVEFAVERKMAAKAPDYWDYATRLELAVLREDKRAATKSLGDALAHQREGWEAETTARNLRLIREAREKRGEDVAWLKEIEETLVGAS